VKEIVKYRGYLRTNPVGVAILEHDRENLVSGAWVVSEVVSEEVLKYWGSYE
jgi:hypothetical protein